MTDILKHTEIKICLNRGIVYMRKNGEDTTKISNKTYIVKELQSRYKNDKVVSAITQDIK